MAEEQVKAPEAAAPETDNAVNAEGQQSAEQSAEQAPEPGQPAGEGEAESQPTDEFAALGESGNALREKFATSDGKLDAAKLARSYTALEAEATKRAQRAVEAERVAKRAQEDLHTLVSLPPIKKALEESRQAQHPPGGAARPAIRADAMQKAQALAEKGQYAESVAEIVDAHPDVQAARALVKDMRQQSAAREWEEVRQRYSPTQAEIDTLDEAYRNGCQLPIRAALVLMREDARVAARVPPPEPEPTEPEPKPKAKLPAGRAPGGRTPAPEPRLTDDQAEERSFLDRERKRSSFGL